MMFPTHTQGLQTVKAVIEYKVLRAKIEYINKKKKLKPAYINKS